MQIVDISIILILSMIIHNKPIGLLNSGMLEVQKNQLL